MWGNAAQLWFLSAVLFSHNTHTNIHTHNQSYRAAVTPSHLTQDKAVCESVCVSLCWIYVTLI